MNNVTMLNELKNLLNEKLPVNHVEQVILFGSRVKGTARDYSDYDVLITLRDDYDWRLRNRVSDVCFDIGLHYDILIDSKVISRGEMKTIRGKQPFIQDALAEGIRV